MRTMSLPMYFFPGVAAANAALWKELQVRLQAKGVDIRDVEFDGSRPPVPDGSRRMRRRCPRSAP